MTSGPHSAGTPRVNHASVGFGGFPAIKAFIASTNAWGVPADDRSVGCSFRLSRKWAELDVARRAWVIFSDVTLAYVRPLSKSRMRREYPADTRDARHLFYQYRIAFDEELGESCGWFDRLGGIKYLGIECEQIACHYGRPCGGRFTSMVVGPTKFKFIFRP